MLSPAQSGEDRHDGMQMDDPPDDERYDQTHSKKLVPCLRR